jgi:hypothetical protein
MLVVAQLIQKFPAFCATQKYMNMFAQPSLDAILSHTNPVYTLIKYYSPIHALVFPSSLRSESKFCKHFASLTCVLNISVPTPSLDHPNINLINRINYEAPLYVISSAVFYCVCLRSKYPPQHHVLLSDNHSTTHSHRSFCTEWQ